MKIRDGIGKAFGAVALAALFSLTYAGCAAPPDEDPSFEPDGAFDEALGVASEAIGVCTTRTKFQLFHQPGHCQLPMVPSCPQFCAALGCGVKYDSLTCQNLPPWGIPQHIEHSFTEYCYCGPNTCIDGIQNSNETGVDCGGPCPACPSCNDRIQNQDETGVDCGGGCQSCDACDVEPVFGEPCSGAISCAYGFQACTGEEILNTFYNCAGGTWNGVDVEPMVPICCASDGECETGTCANGVCLGYTCNDGFEDGIEEGVDCGGDCLPCSSCPAQEPAIGAPCNGHTSCPYGFTGCNGTFVTTSVDTCFNGAWSGVAIDPILPVCP